ncbi:MULTISPECIES: hypothetical protein [Bradyrhizobium]|jgi:hypothetical protein|nr:hypothetical protein [Bradyrhizobium vignae]MBP0113857.1 hypothetical protein [Bradyrhizobium vignae]RXG89315.1 hypothetical protein EAV90_30105 [Bradyrhizobium vignae]
MQALVVVCTRSQLGNKADIERAFAHLMYESDPESGFADVQENTQSSYQDWLKIIRETIGIRRIDALTAK